MRIRVKVPPGIRAHREVLRATLERAVQRATSYATNQAINNAPRKTGTLKRSIHSVINPLVASFTGSIVQDTGVAKYGPFVEYGTGIYGPRGELIRPKTAKMLSWIGPDKKRIFARSVKGMTPRRYMKKAFDDSVPVVKAMVHEEVQKAVQALKEGT